MQANRSYERYHRQIILKGFGIGAQQKLTGARVLVVGAGGLGCPVLMALTGAGVGTIGIADDSRVELSNLHRQFLYTTHDIGKPKTGCAKAALEAMNPDVSIVAYHTHLTNSVALEIIRDYDIVIDGTDNFQTRYMLNDACALTGKPLVYGAVSRFEGQVAVFNGHVNYRDLFPHPPKSGEVSNCSEAGVLGVLPNLIGNFMANECIKLITGTGETLSGKMLTYSALDNNVFIIDITPTAEGFTLLPKSATDFLRMDYPSLCGVLNDESIEIDAKEFSRLVSSGDISVIDVREEEEMPSLKNLSYRRIPLSFLLKNIDGLKEGAVVFICQSGKRSLQAARTYRDADIANHGQTYSLKDGVNGLITQGLFV